MNILNNFRLGSEKEEPRVVIKKINDGVELKSTNLWILIFAIFIASLGLNVNSTAVIIGAMLVSPLMGPIMGIGLGMGVNDLALLKKALLNYLFSAIVALAASTIYFLISPINEAHSEILARVSPTVYDVLIALFGGLAGILALSSTVKGNVIPGVAIATALMPPLCTAGYGLATLQFTYFFGAFYLFLINTVFIASATFIAVRVLKFPFKHLPDPRADLRSKRIILIAVIATILPSIYFAYDFNEQNKFRTKAEYFIEREAIFPNNFLLKKIIDLKKRTITLIYGGQVIEEQAIVSLRQKLSAYGLTGIPLQVKQGFTYLQENNENETSQLKMVLLEKETEVQLLKNRFDSIQSYERRTKQIGSELQTLYPAIETCLIGSENDTTGYPHAVVVIKSGAFLSKNEKKRIEQWLKLRLHSDTIQLFFKK